MGRILRQRTEDIEVRIWTEMLMMVIHNGELMNHSDDVDLMIE